MPTRRSTDPNERAQERFMSNPKYVQRRGILANAVALKADICRPQHRSMLFFLQAMSMRDGGLTRLAAELIDMFPGRLGLYGLTSEQCFALYVASDPDSNAQQVDPEPSNLASYLEDLCTNPEASPDDAGEVVAALHEYRDRRSSEHLSAMVTTSIGEKIDELLDYALGTERMVIIKGDSGSGKTFQAQSWCYRNAGSAVFVSLSGITHRTGFSRSLLALSALQIVSRLLLSCRLVSSRTWHARKPCSSSTRRISSGHSTNAITALPSSSIGLILQW